MMINGMEPVSIEFLPGMEKGEELYTREQVVTLLDRFLIDAALSKELTVEKFMSNFIDDVHPTPKAHQSEVILGILNLNRQHTVGEALGNVNTVIFPRSLFKNPDWVERAEPLKLLGKELGEEIEKIQNLEIDKRLADLDNSLQRFSKKLERTLNLKE